MIEQAVPRILLVEDDRDLGLILREVLEGEGFDVTLAADGYEALDRLDAGPFDLAVTDMMMPVMDGFELLRRLREHHPDLPVLAISAIPEFVLNALREGALDALQKPFDAESLLAHVQALLEQTGRAPEPVRRNAAIEAQRAAATADVGMDPSEGLVRFVARTARLFRVPAAMVSTLSQTWESLFAHCGLSELFRKAGGGPREQMLCHHVVEGSTPLVVHNALEHPSFADNALLQRYGIDFYAGAPLVSREGFVLGALCVMDSEPRRFGHFDLQLLEVLAGRVSGELEWQAHLTAASEPASSYRNLGRYDPELELLGREAITAALAVQSRRALHMKASLTLVVLRVLPDQRRETVRMLETEFPSELLGRLQQDRVALVAFGLDPEAVSQRLRELAPRILWVAVDAGRQIGGTSMVLRDAEAELARLVARPREAGAPIHP